MFTSNRNRFGKTEAPSTLWIADLSAGGLRQPIYRYGLEWPVWSPDGTLIAFSSGPHIYVHELASGTTTPVLTGTQEGYYPSWGPDSRSLAYMATGDESPDLFICRFELDATANPTERRLLVGLPGSDSYPAWSPDGRLVAFVHEELVAWGDGMEATDAVWVVRSDGTEPRRVMRLPMRHRVERLDWLPDGRRLLVSQSRGGIIGQCSLESKRPTGLQEPDDYVQCDATSFLVFRYKRDENGELVLDPEHKICDVSTGEWYGVHVMQATGDGTANPRPHGIGPIAVSPDGMRAAFMSNSSEYPDVFGTTIWTADLSGSNAREATHRPSEPPPDACVVAGLVNDHLLTRVGRQVVIEGTVFHRSGWGSVGSVSYRFRRQQDGKQFAVSFDRSRNAFTVTHRHDAPPTPAMAPGSDDSCSIEGFVLDAGACAVKPENSVSAVVVAVRFTMAPLCGKWSISMRATRAQAEPGEWIAVGTVYVQ